MKANDKHFTPLALRIQMDLSVAFSADLIGIKPSQSVPSDVLAEIRVNAPVIGAAMPLLQ
jgi:hypothetical protein